MATAGEGVRVGRLQPHEVEQNFRQLADALLRSGQLGGQVIYGGVNTGETLELYSESAAKSYFAKFGTGNKLSLGTSATERLAIDANGFITVPGMHNVTGNTSTSQSITSGSYTPTITAGTNIAAVTARTCYWLRVGSLVLVFGACDIDPTATNAVSEYAVSLPIASTLSIIPNLAGTMGYIPSAGQAIAGIVRADTVSNRALMDFTSDATADNRVHRFIFGYLVT